MDETERKRMIFNVVPGDGAENIPSYLKFEIRTDDHELVEALTETIAHHVKKTPL